MENFVFVQRTIKLEQMERNRGKPLIYKARKTTKSYRQLYFTFLGHIFCFTFSILYTRIVDLSYFAISAYISYVCFISFMKRKNSIKAVRFFTFTRKSAITRNCKIKKSCNLHFRKGRR